MKIEVTEDDIELSGHQPHNCPIARALDRHTQHQVGIFETTLWIADKMELNHESKILSWIISHDNLDEPESFSFRLSAECFIRPRKPK